MRKIYNTHFHTALRFRPFFFICGLLMVVSEIWKQYCLTFLVNHGTYNWWYFPFQLCSTPMYVLLFLPYIKEERLCNACLTFLMSFGLLGGIAVFADTTGLHYPLPALTIHSYMWHILLIIISLFAAAALFSGTPTKLQQMHLHFTAIQMQPPPFPTFLQMRLFLGFAVFRMPPCCIFFLYHRRLHQPYLQQVQYNQYVLH